MAITLINPKLNLTVNMYISVQYTRAHIPIDNLEIELNIVGIWRKITVDACLFRMSSNVDLNVYVVIKY